LVFLFGFDAEDAGVASWAGGVAFAEFVEDFGEEEVWSLFCISLVHMFRFVSLVHIFRFVDLHAGVLKMID
jgi:hypothetical protein